MQSGSNLFIWFDTIIGLEKSDAVYTKSLKMNLQQTNRESRSMLDGWEVHSYVIIPSLCMQYDKWVLSDLFSLVGPLHLIGMWFREDQRANNINTHEITKKFDYIIKYGQILYIR